MQNEKHAQKTEKVVAKGKAVWSKLENLEEMQDLFDGSTDPKVHVSNASSLLQFLTYAIKTQSTWSVVVLQELNCSTKADHHFVDSSSQLNYEEHGTNLFYL